MNGQNHDGTISVNGQTHAWTFSAAAGARVIVQLGETAGGAGFTPRIELFSADGTRLGVATDAVAPRLDAQIAAGGEHTVIVSDTTPGAVGGTRSYRLRFVQVPGGFVTPDGDEGGTMTDSVDHDGAITLGDLDAWSFSANAGDRITLQLSELTGGISFTPFIELFGPDGLWKAAAQGATGATLDVAIETAGSYSVVVSDAARTGAGTYRLRLTRGSVGALGANILTNGVTHLGEITPDTRTNVFTFVASAGERIVVRAGELTNTAFSPRLRLYDPSGTQVATDGRTMAAEVTVVAAASGLFTVAVSDAASQSGTYRLTLVKTGSPVVISQGDEGGPLTNGVTHLGTIGMGDLDVWTFTANAGDSVMLRMGDITGTATLDPWLRVYGPDGTLLASDARTVAASLLLRATNSGTFLVVAGDGTGSATSGNSGTGTYRLTLAKTGSPLVISEGDEGGALINGTTHLGAIEVGDIDAWTFMAEAGDSVVLHMGDITGTATVTPWLRVYGPDGTLLGNDGRTVAASVQFRATNSGTFLMVAGDGSGSATSGNSGTGTYRLTLAKTGSPLVISEGDEGGALINGTTHLGIIDSGDIDAWTFTANAGDSVMLRMGDITGTATLDPWLRVYGPDGTLLASDARTVAASLLLRATNSGTFLVVAGDGTGSATSGNSGTGTYRLTLAKTGSPLVISQGDEGGPLVNGTTHLGLIETGDIDAWTFTANAGDNIVLRMGDITGTATLVPWLRVYGPDGTLLGNDGRTVAASVQFRATNSGTFMVVAGDGTGSATSGNSGTGTYRLTLAKTGSPLVISEGDEGGALTNGVMHLGAIEAGDIDAWTFTANAGDNIVLRMGDITGTATLSPWLRLYGPDGTQLDSDAGAVAAEVLFRATNSGTFLVVAGDGTGSATSGNSGTGAYRLTLAFSGAPAEVSSGDEGGAMINGLTVLGALEIGDIDAWSFDGTLGDSNVVRFTASGLTVRVQLYGPTGLLLRNLTTASSNSFNYVVTNAGLHTVVLRSSTAGGTGSYTVKLSRVPPDLIVPDTQILDELTPLLAEVSAQNPDEPDKPLAFTLLDGPPGLTLTPDGPTNAIVAWTPTEADGPSTNVVTAYVTDVVNGVPYRRTNSFTVIVREVNTAPALALPATQSVNEQSAFHLTAAATDTDLPVNPLSFALLSPPVGMTINPATGAIAWTPTEAQGPSTNTVTVVVTDSNPWDELTPSLSTTSSFVLVVHEVNTAPLLTVPGHQELDELTTMSVTATATDADLPANSLAFSLLSPPSGMMINAASGAIAWTPSEAQGPSTNTVTVVVTDANPWAVNSQQLRATNTFTVVVREVNSAPLLPAQADRTLDELTTLSVTNTATDADLPANTLTYVLLAAPSGAIISEAGVITWTPTEAQGPSTNTFTTVVADSNPWAVNAKQLSATNTFTVVVREVNTTPVLTVPGHQELDELTTLSVTATAIDADLPANILTFSLLSPPTGMTINSASGAIAWTPSEAQGPSTNLVRVVVTDNGSPALATTNSFTVIVREVNTAPVLALIGNVTNHFGLPLTVQAEASDADLPANTLTYGVVSGPEGLTIAPATGLISWTPSVAQQGTHPVSIQVTDNGAPALDATRSFEILVIGSSLAIQRQGDGRMRLDLTGDTRLDYTIEHSTNLVHWADLLELRLTTSPESRTDEESLTVTNRFYRLRLR